MDCLDCKICQVPYDEEEHKPRHALCGHELCSACIRALIKDSTFECPKCRQKNIVDNPDDLPISFGLIDVIRAFKTMKNSIRREIDVGVPEATNLEDCKVHKKNIRHRCLKCKSWLCDDCQESHSTLIGCSMINSTEAINSMKKEYNENVDRQLKSFEKDVNQVSMKIQKQSDEKNRLLEKLEKNEEETKRLQHLLEEGNNLLEDLKVSKSNLNEADSPFTVSDTIDLLTRREQTLRIWSMKNIERPEPKSRHDLLKVLEEDKNVFVEQVFKNVKRQAKLSQDGENIMFPSFKTQTIASDAKFIPFQTLKKIMPKEPSLVFIELSLGGVVKGHVLLRLDNKLPNIRENMVTIIMGQEGKSLAGIKLSTSGTFLYNETLLFKEISFTPESSGINIGNNGDVVGVYKNGFLGAIYLHVGKYNYPNMNYKVVGCIVAGMDIIQQCNVNISLGVLISDCGLVI